MAKEDLVAVTIHTTEYRGDHSADVQIAYAVHPDVTVGQLLRLKKRHGDRIEIPIQGDEREGKLVLPEKTEQVDQSQCGVASEPQIGH